MKLARLLRRFDPLRVVVLLLSALPMLAVAVLGILWLWQNDYFLWWLGAMVACAAAAYGIQVLLIKRQRKLLADAATEPNPDWPPTADEVWSRVEALADELDPEDWPLDDVERLLGLGRRTLDTVAEAYHPGVDKPLLELTVPHMLLIIERASADLRRDIVDHVPFSHRLVIGDIFRMQRWRRSAEKVFLVYRAGRMVINPVHALVGEAWRGVRDLGVGAVSGELHRWLLGAFVRKVGFYAIDLYSGRLPLDESSSTDQVTEASRKDDERAAEGAKASSEPLRILVLGRSNAGKSSLINALFGTLAAAADALPDTTVDLVPYALEREGMTRALVFDSPGCENGLFEQSSFVKAARSADFVLWVSPVNRPDRQQELQCLEQLRAIYANDAARRPPPILAVATHIDRLRPTAEWQPPYDLVAAETPKAVNIRDAVAALASDLAFQPQDVVPVCLAEGRVYNVDDLLWSAMLDRHDSALRIRLMRCVEARRRAENWGLLRRQLVGAGRLLWRLSGRAGKN